MDFDATADGPKKLLNEIYKYPTDLRLRFRLGAALFERQKYYDVIPELQKAMYDPYTRLRAMSLLIKAYEATGQSDLAARLRETFSKESGDESGSGSAPVPASTRPIRPRGSAGAKKRPHEDESD